VRKGNGKRRAILARESKNYTVDAGYAIAMKKN
jgi:hypothetical protein